MSSKNIGQKSSEIKSPKRKRKKKKDPFLKLGGIKKLVLSEATQKQLECVAGVHITIENPWVYIQIKKLQDNLELHEESSEFLPIKQEIMRYPAKEVYVGYAADDAKDDDEFYICTTPESVFMVKELYAKIKREQEERLQGAIYKSIREWTSFGSEQEVDDAVVKNNRPLIEVEVEAGYPISPARVGFDLSPAEKRRDGYMELKWTAPEALVNVFKSRIDVHVQVAPQYTTREVQTNCTYPANASTQYEYVVENPGPLLAKCEKPIKQYAEENLDKISDMLRVNGVFNLYSEDYVSLINDDSVISAIVTEEVKEYISFMDVELCKEKMISDVVFHPLWTGTAAVAYNLQAPFIYHSGPHSPDAGNKTVEGTNPVLIWSCLDGLKPKLILKSPREVIKLAFCKFDANILLGGLANGQIVIWDIRNKLQQVEDTQILTTAQVKNRAYMKSLLHWMKIVHDVAVVSPAVVSDLKYSHTGPVTGINWVSPFYEFTKLGRLVEIPDDANPPHSMQFITGAEDGTVCIWDLLRTPQIDPGGIKPRKLKRLKKRPSALMMDASPLSVLNLNLRPIYKMVVPRQRNKPLAIASCHEDLCPMKYVETNSVKGKKAPFSERIIYEPVLDKSLYRSITPQIQVGSMEGDYLHVIWEGQDFDSGEMINSETAIVKSRGRYHDGPLNTTQKNSQFNVTLSVGGRVFALWHEKLKDRPLVWRKATKMYTSGEWNISHPYLFTNKIINGDVETWSIAFDSKSPSFSLTFSSGMLSASAYHSLKQRRTVYAAADKLGSLRLFFMPEDSSPGTLEKKLEKFQAFLDREQYRKGLFLDWQAAWNKRKANYLAKIAEEEELARIGAEPENVEFIEEPKEDKTKKEGHTKKKDKQGGIEAFIAKIIRKREHDEETRIKETIIAKKQLDTKELEKRRKPLQKLEEENERKKRKQKQRLREGESIFINTISSLFPDAIKEKPPPPPDPYAATTITKPLCKLTYEDFLGVKDESTDFIANHPYNYEFDWGQVIAVGRERRELLFDILGDKKRSRARRKASRASTIFGTDTKSVGISDTKSVKSIPQPSVKPSVKTLPQE